MGRKKQDQNMFFNTENNKKAEQTSPKEAYEPEYLENIEQASDELKDEVIDEVIDEEIKELIEELEKYKGMAKALDFKKKMMESKEKSVDRKEQQLLQEFEKIKLNELETYKKFEQDKKELIEFFQQEKNREIEYYKQTIEELQRECAHINVLKNKSEKEEFEKQKLIEENKYFKEMIVELEEFKTKYRKNAEFLDLEEIEKLRNKARELEDKLTRVKKQNRMIDEQEKKVEFIQEEYEKEKIEKELLLNKVKRYQRRLKEFERIEKDKGTGDDCTVEIFRGIIEKEEEVTKNQELVKYFGDDKAVESFIDFAIESGFKYDDKTVRGFISAIKSTKFTILKGFSGTGKSSLPELFSMFIGGECEVIPVQPNWKTKQDIMGFYNYFTHKFQPTQLTKTLIRANVNKEKIFFVVLDEMNLARVEYYFSEFNSKLWMPEEKRYIELFEGAMADDDKVNQYVLENKVKITENIIFIGTINEDDSVSPISDKIYDRAQVLDFIMQPSKTTGGSIDEAQSIANKRNFKAVKYSTFKVDDVLDIEVNDIIFEINKHIRENFNRNLAYRAMNQIGSFIKIFKGSKGKEYDAVDLQLVSKFLPKIKSAYTSEYKEKLELLCEEIKGLFTNKYEKLDDKILNKLQIMMQLELLIKELEA